MRTQHILRHIKEQVDTTHIQSAFVVGSHPETLVAQTDLDICLILKQAHVDEALTQLTDVITPLLRGEACTYSFFRGPLKYEHKGLIHFLIYTDKKPPTPTHESIHEELGGVIASYLSEYTHLLGVDFCAYCNKHDINTELLEADVLAMQKKFRLLQEEHKSSFCEWMRTAHGWDFLRTTQVVNEYLYNELVTYYQQNITRAQKQLASNH